MADKETAALSDSKTSPVQNRAVARRRERRWRPTLPQYAMLLVVFLAMAAGPLVIKPTPQTGRLVNLTLMQLNDVYQLLPNGPNAEGGLARIATLQKAIVSQSDHVIFVLSGDTLSPSLESIAFKGGQMIDIWNNLGLNLAVLGNHEFDLGPDVLRQRLRESHFTWLAANVIDKTTGAPFGGAQRFVIQEVDGVRVGIFGLLTADTAQTSQPGPDIEILDPIATARDLVPQMRAQGAQVVIGLTHLLLADDKRLAEAVPLDLILGGHDHQLIAPEAGMTPIYKMGSDARNLGRLDLKIDARSGKLQSSEWTVIPVTQGVQEDARVRAIIDDYENKLGGVLGGINLEEKIGESTVDLDAEQESVRAREANVGDFIADTFREATGADVGLVNGGGLRSDLLYKAGPITNRIVYSILPFKNKVVMIAVTGAELRSALERGVSRIIEQTEDGGFPQIAGLRFVYNGLRPPGSRITSVTVGGQPLDDNKSYKLATISYIAGGNEGYDMFRGKADLLPPGSNQTDADLVRQKIKQALKISPTLDGRISRQDAP